MKKFIMGYVKITFCVSGTPSPLVVCISVTVRGCRERGWEGEGYLRLPRGSFVFPVVQIRVLRMLRVFPQLYLLTIYGTFVKIIFKARVRAFQPLNILQPPISKQIFWLPSGPSWYYKCQRNFFTMHDKEIYFVFIIPGGSQKVSLINHKIIIK